MFICKRVTVFLFIVNNNMFTYVTTHVLYPKSGFLRNKKMGDWLSEKTKNKTRMRSNLSNFDVVLW